MWHFVLLWLTCDALIIQRYVKIMTCTDLSVSFRLLVYTRCLFSRLLWLGGGVFNFFWRREAHELHQHFSSLYLLLHLRSRTWGCAAGGRGFRGHSSVHFGCWEHLCKAGRYGQRPVVLRSGSWVPGWIPTLGHLKWHRMPVHELLIQVLSHLKEWMTKEP